MCLSLIAVLGVKKRASLSLLSVKNKVAFIDINCPRPSRNSPECKQWDRVNNMVISWFTNSLFLEIIKILQYFKTVECIWKQLNNRYRTINGTIKIRKKLAFTCQGALDIVSYFNKLKKLWDEIGIMSSNHAKICSYAAKSSL